MTSTSDPESYTARSLCCPRTEFIIIIIIIIIIIVVVVVTVTVTCNYAIMSLSSEQGSHVGAPLKYSRPTVCSKKSDAKIESTITATNLLRRAALRAAVLHACDRPVI